MSEVDEMRAEIRALSSAMTEVQREGSETRKDVKGILEALKELIRIDGDQKRQDDAIKRIGHQVDDHESRLRAVEIATNTNTTKVSGSERLWWLIGMLAVGILTAAATGALH